MSGEGGREGGRCLGGSLVVTAVRWLTLLWTLWIIVCNSGWSQGGWMEQGCTVLSACVRARLCTRFPQAIFFCLCFFSSSATFWPCLSRVLQCIQRLQSGIIAWFFCDWCVTGTILRAADGSHLLLLIQCSSHTSRDSSVRVLNTKREQNEGITAGKLKLCCLS